MTANGELAWDFYLANSIWQDRPSRVCLMGRNRFPQ